MSADDLAALADAIAPFLDDPPLRDDVDLTRIGRYRGFGEVVGAIAALRDRGARVTVAGRSHEGAPVLRVDIGDVRASSGSLMIAGTHAMEWIGVEVALAILDAIADEPGDRRIVAFPVLNPDGYRRAERDLRSGRKMRYSRANARGVDLNRNWPTHWAPTGLIPRVLPLLGSAGSHPASEPEIRAVLDTILEVKEAGHTRLERALSLHSFGAVLLLPYGGRWALPPEHPRLHAMAREVRRALRKRYGIRSVARWVPGFFAHGMEVDHLLHEGMSPLLVECSRGGLSFFDPSSWVVPFRWYNPPRPVRHVTELQHALLPFLGFGHASE
ncbi:M14 family metallopeptidase [Sandaracinus amylolyticus]|uniref:Carboxypeptidase T n=1 Tax=Sandaracinus amylolyticus TaxID=927083 RepID=A0A0F6W932_9BACT|nr:M14 family metallopeptidase [Sandaracinus amylolyticus]AKF10523.1 Carboxypeptidase T [Sandaracinus amylolyticus]